MPGAPGLRYAHQARGAQVALRIGAAGETEPSCGAAASGAGNGSSNGSGNGGPAFDPNPWVRWALGLSILLNLSALWLSAARGALLGAAVMTVVFALGCLVLGDRPLVRRAALAFLALTAGGAALLAVAVFTGHPEPVAESSVMVRRLRSAAGDDNSVNSRLTAVRVGAQAYRDRPVLGWGPENFGAAWGRHITADLATDEIFDQAHSKVIEVAATTGTAGLFAYLLLCLLLLAAAARAVAARRGGQRLFALAMATALAGYFIQCVVMFDTLSFILQFSLIAGYLAWEEGRRAPEGWGAASSGLRHRLARLPGAPRWRGAPGGGGAGLLAALALAGLLAFGLFQYNLRPYQAALHRPIEGTLPEIVLNQRESMDRFPPLANLRRLFLLTNADGVLSRMSAPAEVAASVELLAEEIERALALEPESWRVRQAAALLYAAAAVHDPAYLEPARRHLAELERLSPRSIYTEEARRALAEAGAPR